jgi:hypothetical protein
VERRTRRARSAAQPFEQYLDKRSGAVKWKRRFTKPKGRHQARRELAEALMDALPHQHCYLCGRSIRAYALNAGERPPPDALSEDHVPPKGLFPSPRPDNLVKIPCCFECNNQHSGFDERLRMVASMPFDRNKAGEWIANKAVIERTLKKGRQMEFVGRMMNAMEPMPEHPDLLRVRMDATEFREGMIRITKGLLFVLHPNLNYLNSKFFAMDITPNAFDEQLRTMGLLKNQGDFFERGNGVFKSWRHVDEARGGGMWMLLFYECFGFFVSHTNGSELDRFFEDGARPT